MPKTIATKKAMQSSKVKIITEYNATIDNKGRFLLRGKKGFTHVHVQEFEDGSYLIEPKYLASIHELSEKTLAMMDKSVENIKKGKVSPPIDINDL